MCARAGLECIVYMGAKDMERQALNVFRMRLLGAEVRQKGWAGVVWGPSAAPQARGLAEVQHAWRAGGAASRLSLEECCCRGSVPPVPLGPSIFCAVLH